ncbi:Flagellar motor switch protein FliN [Thalassovita gelatinovora]|uniref:Flagellar motor switch protein FliN n=1 Tax=Thalassovita gelatinovora TaxID=53501 RepID=A0A0P1G7F4_THAGE|nr:flagellar motor switch protein FliN [Thalassovita gelatinovora]QIZ82402.1 flagellar motor switch protein FliN [Thalassovita gelatinovora]CUH68483.1 Flagellar motor switch protein FliN [Thalassovita gelatinovora]SEQ53237.1 flagellar motor switch protein FliN/FliY [Thalassovita gelatinovora]
MSEETTLQEPSVPATTPQPEVSEASQLLSGLGVLETVKVRLTVEVGRTEITIQDLLKLNEGSVVELDRMAGDPLDIQINGTTIAKGEVVVIGERFGIRFGDIVDPKDRMHI